MLQTEILGLKKPEQNDFYNVDDQNSNMDILEQVIVNNAHSSTSTRSFRFSIPASDWRMDSGRSDGYKYYADIAIEYASASMRPKIIFDIDCLEAATEATAFVSATLEEGKVRVFAKKLTAAVLTGDCLLSTEGEVRFDATKTKAKSCALPLDGWASDDTEGYPKYIDIADPDVKANDRLDAIAASESSDAVIACGFAENIETSAGSLRIRAANLPKETINIEYWIVR